MSDIDHGSSFSANILPFLPGHRQHLASGPAELLEGDDGDLPACESWRLMRAFMRVRSRKCRAVLLDLLEGFANAAPNAADAPPPSAERVGGNPAVEAALVEHLQAAARLAGSLDDRATAHAIAVALVGMTREDSGAGR